MYYVSVVGFSGYRVYLKLRQVYLYEQVFFIGGLDGKGNNLSYTITKLPLPPMVVS